MHTGDNRRTVIVGQTDTSRVSTAAATVMHLLGRANWWIPRWLDLPCRTSRSTPSHP